MGNSEVELNLIKTMVITLVHTLNKVLNLNEGRKSLFSLRDDIFFQFPERLVETVLRHVVYSHI